MARALVAEVDFQAVGEEGEEVGDIDVDELSAIVPKIRRSTKHPRLRPRMLVKLYCDQIQRTTPIVQLIRRSASCRLVRGRTRMGELPLDNRWNLSDSSNRISFSSTIRITPNAARRSA